MYRTCVGCQNEKQPCAARDALRAHMKGFGVTSIKWKCKDRVPRIVVGDPVWALTHDGSNEYDDDGEPFRDYFPGTAIKQVGAKFVVFIEPGAEGRDNDNSKFTTTARGFCKIPLSRITAREGERETVCRYCEQPNSKGHVQGYSCNPDPSIW